MAKQEEPQVPIWAEAKAKKQIDVLKEVAGVVKSIDESERVRASQAIPSMTERDLAAEQFRLEALLHEGTLTVDNFHRLREIDFYLQEMRDRRHRGPTHEEWKPERLSDG
jgi:hypothetical protein